MNETIKPQIAPVLASQPKPPPSRFRRLLPFLLGTAAVAAIVFGNWEWQVGRFQESTDNATIAADISPLSPRIEGDVLAILVADNARVTAGQPLIQLDPADWQARRDGAAASLAAAEASIATSRAQAVQGRAQVEAARAQIGTAEAERVRATADASRFGTLAQSGVGSRENAERTLADRRKAEATVAAAQANLAAAEAALPLIAAQEQAAVANRDAARATLALAESSLSYTVIRAPFDGVAGNRAAQLGQHVRAGQPLIAVAQDRQWVTANFKETQLDGMRPGQPVRVSPDISGHELRGRVESEAPATGALFSLLPPENATGNFTKIVQRVPVRVVVPAELAAQGILRPGLSVVVDVDTRTAPAPSAAIPR
jgi:membrane fusion protein (multidrug efflux system)